MSGCRSEAGRLVVYHSRTFLCQPHAIYMSLIARAANAENLDWPSAQCSGLCLPHCASYIASTRKFDRGPTRILHDDRCCQAVSRSSCVCFRWFTNACTAWHRGTSPSCVCTRAADIEGCCQLRSASRGLQWLPRCRELKTDARSFTLDISLELTSGQFVITCYNGLYKFTLYAFYFTVVLLIPHL